MRRLKGAPFIMLMGASGVLEGRNSGAAAVRADSGRRRAVDDTPAHSDDVITPRLRHAGRTILRPVLIQKYI